MYASILIALAAVAAQPMPDKASVDAAQRLVRETYRAELSAEDGLKKILDAADETADDPAGQAAMYLVVAREATSSGWLKTAFDAVDRMEQRFEYDALAAKVTMLENAVKHAKTIDARTSLANRCFELLDQAIAEERFDVADNAAKVAGSVVPKLRDADMRKQLAGKRKDLDKLKKEYDAQWKSAAEAEATLKTSPGDGKANGVVGRRLAALGDWQRALPHLAKADDDDLRNAALQDLSAANNPKQQVVAADRWWDVADSTDGKEQRAYRSRAVYWYTLAMPSMTGLLKTRAEKRITDAGQVDLAGQTSGDDSKVTILLAPGVPLVLVKIPASADGKVKAFWLGETEVTQKQWMAVMGSNPSNFKGEDNPVDSVTHDECKAFCRRVGEKATRLVFRLPSADEHKHVQFTAFKGVPVSALPQYAWEIGNSGERPHPVAKMKADGLGLFDLVGNAYEWSNSDTMFLGGSWHDQQSGPPDSSQYNGITNKKGDKGINIGLRIVADTR